MNSTKSILTFLIFTLLSLLSGIVTAAPLGTAFTYQGKLTDGGAPANGNYDLKFTLFDAATNGNQVGVTLTNVAIAVSNGLFTTTLDFGADAFSGDTRWLEIGVQTQ